MSSKASLNAVVYAGIKSAILRGDFAPGERLDGRTLEGQYEVSSTPVRNALYRLFGEGLIEHGSTDGVFHMPGISERSIGHLYTLEDEILGSCVRAAKRHNDFDERPSSSASPDNIDVVAVTELLFTAVAAASMNAEFLRVVGHVNDRLRIIRAFEGTVMPGRSEEILEIERAWISADYTALLSRLKDYHRIRLASVRRTINAAEKAHKVQ